MSAVTGSRARVCTTALVALALGCSLDWDALDPRGAASSGGSIGGAGGAGGATGGGAGAGGDGGRAVGSGGAGGGGGAPALIDRALLTRYFVDEAASGIQPSELTDSAPSPLPLALDYGETDGGGGAGGSPGPPNMTFDEVAGNRGLSWTNKSLGGMASVAVTGSKLLTLNGVTAATVECVVDITDAGSSGVCGRISHLGVASHGNLTLCSNDGRDLSLRMTDMPREEWNVELETLGRVVLHAVVDTTHPDADARLRLFIDGVDRGVGDKTNSPPTQGQPITVSSGHYVLGNRINEDGATRGHLFYCALYAAALDDAEVAHNAALLMASDDTP